MRGSAKRKETLKLNIRNDGVGGSSPFRGTTNQSDTTQVHPERQVNSVLFRFGRPEQSDPVRLRRG